MTGPTATEKPQAPGPRPPATADRVGLFTRARRQKVNLCLHPTTMDDLLQLALRFAVPRGVIVDRAVNALGNEIRTGTCHCAHNRPCPHNRQDVPGML